MKNPVLDPIMDLVSVTVRLDEDTLLLVTDTGKVVIQGIRGEEILWPRGEFPR